MAEKYAVSKTRLDGLAEEVQTLMGESGGMTMEEMQDAVSAANAEVSTQTDLIAELASVLAETSAVLDGKAGGGGSGGAAVETCTVRCVGCYGDGYYTALDGDKITIKTVALLNNPGLNDVVVGGLVIYEGGFACKIDGDAAVVNRNRWVNVNSYEYLWVIHIMGDCTITSEVNL